MFQCSSVPRMPIMSPAAPVMTPAERSNSPPIISSATSTAGMPIVDATSVQFEIPSSFRNSDACVQKKIAMTIAATRAPISGRRSNRAIGLILAIRSSAGLAGGGACDPAVCGETAPDAIRLSLIWMSLPRVRRAGGRPEARPPPVVSQLAGSCPRELCNRQCVCLVDVAGAGQDRLPAANRVGVRLEELQEHNRQVTLQILLLIDREQHGPVLDVREPLRAQVERRQLRARAGALNRRHGGRGDVRVEGDDSVERLVGLQLRLDLRLRGRDVRRALDVDVGHGSAEALLHALTALL